MHEGASWSGHERNCCFLNLRDGTFADVSAVTGLDFLDDGRALAVCDWDGDGDLDLWLKNRTGPQLRFMRNAGTPGHRFLAIKLRGTTCNRDAIGAAVEVEAGGKRLTQTVVAGDGYLSQSGKWLHFGLGTAERIERVAVHWPGGDVQQVEGLEVDTRYTVTQGESKAQAVEARHVDLPEAPGDSVGLPGSTRVVLKVPLPLPPSLTDVIFDEPASKRPTLVNLWAHWCAPCVTELTQLATQYERLCAAGLAVLALNVDEPKDQAAATELFAERVAAMPHAERFRHQPPSERRLDVIGAILAHVRDQRGPWPLPASFLVNGEGRLQILYLGPVEVEQLLSDLNDYGRLERPAHLRTAFPGRWYYRTRRDLAGLADELDRRGRREEANFYRKLP